MKKLLLAMFASGCLWAGANAADSAGTAAAKEEIAKGNYQKATELFAEAVRQNPADANAKGAYTYMKGIISKIDSFAHEENPERKQALGQVLRNFYFSVGNVNKALEVDQAIYAVAPTSDNAVKLGSTLVYLQKNQEAEAILAKVTPATTSVDLLSAIIAARKGDLAKNRELVAKVPFKDLKRTGEQLLYARAVAAAGDKAAAIETVKTILTNTETKKLATVRSFIAKNADFAKLVNDNDFKQVLEAKYAVKGCDGDCSKCPKRPKDKPECSDCEKEKQAKAATGN